MADHPPMSNRVRGISKSAIHEMTRLSKEVDDVAFLPWAKPTSDTPGHIKQGAIAVCLLRPARHGPEDRPQKPAAKDDR